MIPLRDNIRSTTTPYVNYGVIAACAVVFFLQLREKPGDVGLVERFGMIPQRVIHPDRPVEVRVVVQGRFGEPVLAQRELPPPSVSPWLTVLTCIFLHGGWLHFLGNMWFLYIFGDNVEDRFGHWGYVVFYLFAGVGASLFHLATNASSTVPTIGASGAIAGVMGAYLLLHPRATVLTAVPIIYFIEIIVLPAPLFLGIWFVIQFFQGTMSISSTQTGGVAWWAHIGGFIVGFVVVWILRKRRGTPRVEVLPGTQRPFHHRRFHR